VEAHRYLELARREAEHARKVRKLSEAAERFALRQADEGLRDHFLRVAARAELESLAHTARARHFEAIAANGSRAAIGRRRAGSSTRRAVREANEATARANAELVRRMLAASLRHDFGVAPEYLTEQVRERATTAP
jgi:hypothetical protein